MKVDIVYSHEDKLDFGKYEGCTVSQVIDDAPNYLRRMIEKGNIVFTEEVEMEL